MAVTATAAVARSVRKMVGTGKRLQYPIKTIAILEVKKVPAMTRGGLLVRSLSTNFNSVSRLMLDVLRNYSLSLYYCEIVDIPGKGAYFLCGTAPESRGAAPRGRLRRKDRCDPRSKIPEKADDRGQVPPPTPLGT
jgi:hypothetical protein